MSISAGFEVAAADGPAPYELDCTAFCAKESTGDSIASVTVSVASGTGVLGTGLRAPVVQALTTVIYWMDFTASQPGDVTVVQFAVTTASGHGPFHKTIAFTAT